MAKLSWVFSIRLIAMIIAAFLGLLFFIRADVLIAAIYLFTIAAVIFNRRFLPYFLISTVMAIIWIAVAKSQYGYNQDSLVLLGFDIFPLLCWALGLFASYLIISKFKGTWLRFPVYLLIYWGLLIAVETLAYHVIGVRNIQTGSYPGLPLCDCMHAPRWMQAAYLSMGPIYYMACQIYDKKKTYDKMKK